MEYVTQNAWNFQLSNSNGITIIVILYVTWLSPMMA